jgi:protein-tyrosine phosphatase
MNGGDYGAAMTARILMVCTANVCRSPMAEVLLRRHLSDAGIDAVVSSAGTRNVGLPVDPKATAVLAEMGHDLTTHRPRPISREILTNDGAGLIITMTREHLRDVVALDRSTWKRTFTLRELVHRVSTLSTTPDSPTTALQATSEGLAAWAGFVATGRKAADMLTDDPSDDISDPYTGSSADVLACARDIDMLTGLVARNLSFL